MTRAVLAVTLIIYHLLALCTGVDATCEACPNCDYEQISPSQGDACLNYWTCSGDTISCYYPSVANPGTYTGCSYSASAVSSCFSQQCMHTYPTMFGKSQGWGLTGGPSNICFSVAGVNDGCQPGNDPYSFGLGACTASYGYVGGVNSGLLKRNESMD
ncbi:hypothetical protein DFH29DRAFT_559950 [Suillus ampliporus]|nr:hypothetical protein DFH29DRAFT_559950 [Suillus ampliporus]